jgi:serine/threonine protein kinase
LLDETKSKSRIQLPILPLMANAPRLSVVRDQARPKKLGRYELEECLGAAGGIETYRARVRGLAGFDRIFAVKCLRRPRTSPITLNDPYVKVAKRTAMVNDARIARVLDADVVDGVAIAVTEFVHGLDLERFRECAQVSGVLATGTDENADKWQKIVAYLGAEAAGGLAALHGLAPPVLHGGLVPRNIIATARGGLKILDVGLALAAQLGGEPLPERTRAYAAPEGQGGEAEPRSDVRALGAILFELATGEMPPPGASSMAAKRALDALWPSMADFLASMLSEDPDLRPSSAEVAKVLAAHWADVPDASMVTEMATLVRNFSAFVADTTLTNTAPPIPHEPARQAATTPAPPASVIAIPSPAPPPPPVDEPPIELAPIVAKGAVEGPQDAAPDAETTGTASSGSFFAIHDAPTRVHGTGSYANALFQALPTDADMSRPFETSATGAAVSRVEPENEGSSPSTLKSFPTADLPVPVDPRATGALPSRAADLEVTTPIAVPASLAMPVPELTDWGARALAALGDQAGVAVTPVPLATTPAERAAVHLDEPPPPVSDPAIEEAFAFLPPVPTDMPVEPAVAPRLAPSMDAIPPSGLLEDELVDEHQESVAVVLDEESTQAPVELSPEATLAPPPFAINELGAQTDTFAPPTEPVLEAVAFAEESTVAPASEWIPPRLAHAMSASDSGTLRRSTARTALKSARNAALEEPGDRRLSPRSKRILLALGVSLALGGAATAAVIQLDLLGRKAPSAGKATPLASTKPSVASAPKSAKPIAAVEPSKVAPLPTASKAGKASAPHAETAGKPNAPGKVPTTAQVKAPSPAAPAGKTPEPIAAKPTTATAPPAPKPTTVSAIVAAQPARSADKTEGGGVAVPITTAPDGATVWVDGEERCKSPCQVKLKTGRSRVLLVRPGYVSYPMDLDVREGAKLEATLKQAVAPMTGEARFRADCQTTGKFPIVVDGIETGVLCPFTKLRVEPGRHTIGLLIPATGKVHEKEVTLSPGVRSVAFGD